MGLFNEARSTSREYRDPRGATLAQSFVGRNQPQPDQFDGEGAIRNAYMANTHVFACVNVLAKALAGARLMSGPTRGKVSTARIDTPIYKLLSHPNAHVTQRKLLAHTVIQRHVTGKWGWEYDFGTDGRYPIGLYPLIASKLRPIPSAGGPTYFKGYRYDTPGTPGQPFVEFQLGDILYAWMPGATDFRQPESPIQAARMNIEVATQWDRFQYAFLRNDARPSVIIQTPQFDDREEYERFKHSYLSEHQGSENGGKALFTEVDGDDPSGKPAVQVTPIGTPQKDAQSVEIYRETIKAICIGLGVPYSMLDASGRTFNNGGIEVQNFYEGPVHDVAEDLADEINNQLVPLMPTDDVVWFDFAHLAALRPPSKFMQVNPIDLRDAEIIDDEEIREDIGLTEREDGGGTVEPRRAKLADQALAAQELITAGFDPAGVLAAVGLPPIAVKAVVEQPEPAEPEPDAPDEGTEPTDTAPEPPADMGARTAERETRASKRNELRAAAARAVDIHAQALEPSWDHAMRGMFEKQRVATLDRLSGKRGRRLTETRDGGAPSASDIFDPEHWTAATTDVVKGLYSAVFGVGASTVANQFGVSFSLDHPNMQGAIESRANQLAGHETDVTYQAITAALNQGLAAGDDQPALANRVSAVFDAGPARASAIARTEVISGYNAAKDITASAMPDSVVSHKSWVTTVDGATRSEHAAADGQTVTKSEPFRVGGENLSYPGDPSGSAENCVNCRCTQIFLSPEDVPSEDRSTDMIEYDAAVSSIRNTRRSL